MKALILESKDGRAVALWEDGQVITVPGEWTVGETADLPEGKAVSFPRRKRRWVQAVVAASLAFVVLTGSYTYTTAWACSYVSLETEEAAVELAVNRLGQVIEVKALDENSAELAQTLTDQLRRKPVEDAVELAVERLKEDGRVARQETVVAGVTDENEQRGAQLTEKLDRGEELQAVEVSPEQRREAQEQNMGGGRFVREQTAPPQEAPADPPAWEQEPGEPGEDQQERPTLPAQESAPEQPADQDAPPEGRQETPRQPMEETPEKPEPSGEEAPARQEPPAAPAEGDVQEAEPPLPPQQQERQEEGTPPETGAFMERPERP